MAAEHSDAHERFRRALERVTVAVVAAEAQALTPRAADRALWSHSLGGRGVAAAAKRRARKAALGDAVRDAETGIS